MNFSGVFGEIIGAVTGLYVANSIPSWHIPVITSSYLQFLPYCNAAIILSAMTKILMYISPWYRLRLVFEGLTELIGIFFLSMLLTIFPFDFTPINRIAINDVLRFAFIIAIIGVSIAFLVTCFRFLRGKP